MLIPAELVGYLRNIGLFTQSALKAFYKLFINEQ